MTSKTWVAGTVIDSPWLQDVNDSTYYAYSKTYAAGTAGAKFKQRKNLRDAGLIADGNYATGAGTDNSALLQAAINLLATTGGGVLVDDGGIYKLSSQVVWPDGVSFIGSGKWSTIFFCPTAFANTNGLWRISGSNGFPTCHQGFSLLAQTGGSGGYGLVSVKNGVFIDDIWVNGFLTGSGIKLSNTDNFLSNFASEQSQQGVEITESSVNVQHGTVYECTQGVLVNNNASVETGRVTLTSIRASSCPQSGFVVSSGKNVTMNSCSASHINNGRFSVAGVRCVSATNVLIDGFSGNIGGTASTTADCISIDSASIGVEISNPEIIGWRDGISTSGTRVTISGGSSRLNGRHGANLNGGVTVKVNGLDTSLNGLTGTGNGVNSINSVAQAAHLITNITSIQASGGPMQNGILANISVADAVTVIDGNICLFNSVADIALSGTTGNIRYGRANTVNIISDTPPSVASVAALTLPPSGDTIAVTGTTNITSIAATGSARRVVTLNFASALTVVDASNLVLNGNLVTATNTTLTLYCNGTNWYEIARSVN